MLNSDVSVLFSRENSIYLANPVNKPFAIMASANPENNKIPLSDLIFEKANIREKGISGGDKDQGSGKVNNEIK